MVDVDKAVVLKYTRKGLTFSIMVDPEKALEFRKNKCSLNEVLAVENIFTDVKKGIRASDIDLNKAFGTSDKLKVSEIMVRDGEMPVTKKQKDEKREEIKKKIIDLICKNAVDPKTGLPHPPQRIESAMNEAKVNINDRINAEEQINAVLKAINSILPIKFEVKKLELVIPSKFAGSAYGIIKREAKILKNEWGNDGSLRVVIEVPAGVQDKFFTDVNHACHGEMESKEIK